MSRPNRRDPNADDQRRAQFMVAIAAAGIPRLEMLPTGAMKVAFIEFIAKHGAEFGLSTTPPLIARSTLLDAKTEIDERCRDLEVPSFAQSVPDSVFRELAEGTSLKQSELIIACRHSAGRHIRDARIEREALASGQFGYGALTGALAQAWAF